MKTVRIAITSYLETQSQYSNVMVRRQKNSSKSKQGAFNMEMIWTPENKAILIFDYIIDIMEIQELFCWHQWMDWCSNSEFPHAKEQCCIHCGKWRAK